MAGKTYYLLPSVIAAGALLMRDMQDGGSAPTALTSGTGWTVAKTATSVPYSLMVGGTKRAAATFGATAMPNVAPVDGTTGDSFRTPTRLLGTFGNSAWSIAVAAIAVSNAASGVGRIRVRVWKTMSVTGDNTSAVKITDTAATATHAAYRTVLCDTTQSYTVQARMKAGTKTAGSIIVGGISSGRFCRATYNLSAGGSVASTGTSGAGETITSTSISLSGSWYTVAITCNLNTAGDTGYTAEMCPDVGFYLGDGTGTIYATGLQAELGSSASTYEQTWGAAGTVNLVDYSEGNFQTAAATVSLDSTADPFAYAVTELTAATQTGTAVSNLSTSTEQISTVTWSPGTITLANEFLFFQCAWEITSASGNTSADAVLRRNSTALITTPDFPITFSKPLSVRQAVKRAAVY